MNTIFEQNNKFSKIGHSKLGIIAFAIFVSMIIPFAIILVNRWGIIRLGTEKKLFLSGFFTYWFIFAPIVSLVLSITDLKRPNRLKILPKITLVISGLMVGIGILILIKNTISDLSRIF